MAETRVIKAVFGASKSIVAPKRFKNDWGQVLELVGIELPQVFEAHFSNSKTGTAKKRVGQDNRVDVPAEYFESGADIFCWIMVHDAETDGRTMYTVRIPIEDRADVTDVEPTPVEQDVITQAIAALNAAVEKTAQDVESADASARSASDSADRAETARDTAEEYVSTVQNYAQQAQASANSAASSATSSASSAYQAQQIKTDVQGLVSDAQSAAGASAQSATESAQSASQASASATSASQSAETASTKASEASASAQTAGAKATEASGYASTASAKASESSQSASAASGYATQAGQAKTAAETAQGLAEQAQSDAESAKDDAESARDEAQQIVNGISGKVEQIDQNTADIASLEADRYKAYATDTATGAVASFPDGADNIPMADVKVSIEPVQDLSHGDPSPDNICPISGWTEANVSRIGKNWFDLKKFAEVYPQNCSYNETTGELNISSTLRLYSVGIPVDIPLDTSNGGFMQWEGMNGTGTNFRFRFACSDDTVYDQTGSTGATTGYLKYTSQIAAKRITSIRINWTTPGTFTIKNACITQRTNDVPYEPYSGNLYSITFPQEAGTVYGGTLDVTTGELVVDRAMVDLGTLSWTLYEHVTFGNYFYTSASNLNIKYEGIFDEVIYSAVCSMYSSARRHQSSFVNGTFCFDGVYTTKMVTQLQIKDSNYGNAVDFKAAMNGVQLVYKLATPITYQLTPTEIRSLLGTNNVWADTGDTTAEYRADTKLYIQKKIAEAISALS